jgi:trehalose 6-phosphate synthase/phosphatase
MISHNGDSRTRLLIVSNRLPVTITSEAEGEFTIDRSSGGLATALSRTHAERDSLWIGWPGGQFDEPKTQNRIEALLRQEQRCVPVFLSAEDIEQYYHGFSNRALWPLLHYFVTYFTYDEEEWEAYERVNRLFCDAILREAQGNELIWVHDYHLFLLPEMLRQHLPEARIGFFPAYSVSLLGGVPYSAVS